MTTYEDKLLAVFSRFRGEASNQETLEQLERACNAEVWQHLPLDVRSSWRLHLAFSDDSHGQIELRPRQLRADGASPAQLEAALRSPFREAEPVRGGILSKVAFDGAPPRPNPVVAPAAPVAPARSALEQVAVASQVTAASPAAPARADKTASEGGKLDARAISSQAEALGISLPPNSSLLGPFLEALTAATHYRERAEQAEAHLAELLAQLDRATK